MPEIEMMVSLIIPDNTALTSINVLHKMGYHKLLHLKREAYYKFTYEGDSKSFSEKISNVDILVNNNKHSVKFKKQSETFGDSKTRILIKEIDDSGQSILSTLKNRFGFKNLKKVETGTIWALAIDDKPENITSIAWDIARKLFYNKHYQTAEILHNKQ